ncbi:Rib/alpha-like domain-containing protein [Corynebacterium mendelii]|uniref:Long Rib domain-containing protein n=1 Tax=Corynebacterium mendelii TaxID=2765362 RepID=A0A939IWC0_9CORY|nr:Rib/alpha-like domain-containing protein [Corynebacterium mendelii]MBN9643250.1 hypothetical protein [Corynebacterium mendelii]
MSSSRRIRRTGIAVMASLAMTLTPIAVVAPASAADTLATSGSTTSTGGLSFVKVSDASTDLGDGNRVMVTTPQGILLPGGSSWSPSLFRWSYDLVGAEIKDENIYDRGFVAAEAGGGSVVTVLSGKVYRYAVTDSGLSEQGTELAVLPGGEPYVSGVAVGTDGSIAVTWYTDEGTISDSVRTGHVMVIGADGEKTVTDFPDLATLYPGKKVGKAALGDYGGSVNRLKALSDGSFIFYSNNIGSGRGEDNRDANQPLHITVTGTATEVSAFQQGDQIAQPASENSGNGVGSFYTNTDDGSVAFWNYYATDPTMGRVNRLFVMHYADGELTPTALNGEVADLDGKNIGGIVTRGGKAYVYTVSDSLIHTFDLATGTREATFDLNSADEVTIPEDSNHTTVTNKLAIYGDDLYVVAPAEKTSWRDSGQMIKLAMPPVQSPDTGTQSPVTEDTSPAELSWISRSPDTEDLEPSDKYTLGVLADGLFAGTGSWSTDEFFLDKNLAATKIADDKVAEFDRAVFDKATSTLYTTEGTTISKRVIGDTTIGEETVIAELTAPADSDFNYQITGLALQPTGQLAVTYVHDTGGWADGTRHGHVLIVDADGMKKTVDFPGYQDLFGREDVNKNALGGGSTGFPNHLLAMADGSYILWGNSLQDGQSEENPTTAVGAVHIVPTADGAEITEIKGYTAPAENPNNYVKTMYSNPASGYVAMFNNRATNDSGSAAPLLYISKYMDGKLVPTAVNGDVSDMVGGIGGVVTRGDNAYVFDWKTGDIHVIDITTGKKTGTFNMVGTGKLDSYPEIRYYSSTGNSLVKDGNDLYAVLTVNDGWPSAGALVKLQWVPETATPKDNTVYSFSYPQDVTAEKDTAAQAPVTFTAEGAATAVPDNTTFALKEPVDGMAVADDGVVTFTATDAHSGTTVTAQVTATYADGSSASAPVSFAVAADTKDNERYTPSYVQGMEATVGGSASSQISFTADGAQATPENVTYALSSQVDGMTVDADGTVTLTPVEAQADSTVEATVQVTYGDSTTEQTPVSFKVKAAEKEEPTTNTLYSFRYTFGDDAKGGAAKPGDTATKKPIFMKAGEYTDLPAASFPEITGYRLDTPDARSDLSIDSDSGVITFAPTTDEPIPDGDDFMYFSVPVTVTYADGSESSTSTGFTLLRGEKQPVEDKDNIIYSVNYAGVTEAFPSTPVTLAAPTLDVVATSEYETLPVENGTTFAAFPAGSGKELPAGMELADDGSLTYTAPANQQPGTVFAEVEVTFPDSSVGKAIAAFTVKEKKTTTADSIELHYTFSDDGTGGFAKPGESATKKPGFDKKAADGTVNPLREDEFPTVTGYRLTGTDIRADVSIDDKTGVVTFSPVSDKELSADQDKKLVSVTVTATFDDGSESIDAVLFTLVRGDDSTANSTTATTYSVQYAESKILEGPAGTPVAALPTMDKIATGEYETEAIPAGTVFEAYPADSTKALPPNVTVNPTDGSVTFTPSEDQAGSTLFAHVKVTFPDKSVTSAVAAMKVTEKQQQPTAEKYFVYYTGKNTGGGTIDLGPTGAKSATKQVVFATGDAEYHEDVDKDDYPAVTGYSLVTNRDDVTLDASSGQITFAPKDSSDVPDGERATIVYIPVTVTYSDGSTDVATATFTVFRPVSEIDPESVPMNERLAVFFGDSSAVSATVGQPASVEPVADMTLDATFNPIALPADTEIVAYPADDPERALPEGMVLGDDFTVTYTPPVSAAGQSVTGYFLVVFEDGTKGETLVTFAVSSDIPAPPEVNWTMQAATDGSADGVVVSGLDQGTGTVGQPVSVTPMLISSDNSPLPPNALFTLGDSAPSGATINPVTGQVTYTPVAEGSVSIPVVVVIGQRTVSTTVVFGVKAADKQPGGTTTTPADNGTDDTENQENTQQQLPPTGLLQALMTSPLLWLLLPLITIVTGLWYIAPTVLTLPAPGTR